MHEAARPELYLTRQTFIALTDETLVFLDLHRDKYSCLEKRYTKPIGALLGLPVSVEADAPEIDAPVNENAAGLEETVQSLVTNGLVTRNAGQGKRAAFVTQHSDLREMLGYFPGEGPRVRFGDVVNFFKALIVTKSLLKFASMERIVGRVKRRRERFYANGGATPDDERLNEIVETYKILKPLFVTVKDQCLYNSLFLIEFLACYRVYPSWYFGVRLNEFYAHCWVQDRNIVFDDSIMNTSANQPIMTI